MPDCTYRVRLAHSTADKLVFCHESIHIRETVAKASYREEVEKWLFDPDESEDEGNHSDADLDLKDLIV